MVHSSCPVKRPIGSDFPPLHRQSRATAPPPLPQAGRAPCGRGTIHNPTLTTDIMCGTAAPDSDSRPNVTATDY